MARLNPPAPPFHPRCSSDPVLLVPSSGLRSRCLSYPFPATPTKPTYPFVPAFASKPLLLGIFGVLFQWGCIIILVGSDLWLPDILQVSDEGWQLASRNITQVTHNENFPVATLKK